MERKFVSSTLGHDAHVSSFAAGGKFCLLFGEKKKREREKSFMSRGSSSFMSELRQRRFYYCRPSNKLFYL